MKDLEKKDGTAAIQNGGEAPPPEEETPEETETSEAAPEAAPAGKPDKPLLGTAIPLERYPVTPAAHAELVRARLAFNPELRERLVDAAKNAAQQLTLAETGALVERFREELGKREEARRELYDSQPDDGAPAELTCEFPGGCSRKVRPATWNVVVFRGRRPSVLTGRDGEPVRRGNFVIVKDPTTGKFRPLILCRDHYRDYEEEVRRLGKTEEIDTRSYPYAVAKAISDRLNAKEAGLDQLIMSSAKPKPKKRKFWDRLRGDRGGRED